jgi:hypothetical protein
MSFCQHCARTVEAVESEGGRSTCPHCGRPVPADTDDGWTDVARVGNLAEAGFLANDLAGEGIDAQIHAVEEFSGVAGSWSASYLIRVPSDVAQEAAKRIRRHVADDEAWRREPPPRSQFEAINQAVEAFDWRPVAMMVLAGVVCFVIGQQVGRSDARPRPLPPRSLPAAIDAIGRPLLTEPAPGQPRYRLSYQWRQHVWQLDTDTDGDGRFDARREFPATTAGW